MGVMIREWPVKVSFLELTQDIARVQTIVRTCDFRDERDSPQEVPISSERLETHNLKLILYAGLVAILMLFRIKRLQLRIQLFSV